MIVFVGDKASSKNLNPDVAFVGTKSYEVLLSWIAKMNINVNDVMIINKDKIDIVYDSVLSDIESCNSNSSIKIIALGNEAEKVIKKNGMIYFKLPHPSPRNLQTNNIDFIKGKLKECQKWLKL